MSILRSKLLSGAGFAHAWTERGTDHVELAAALAGRRILQTKQVHGSGVALATDAASSVPEADALVLRARGFAAEESVAVGVRVADCASVLVGDDSSGDVAAIHVGWRGVVAHVVHAAIAQLGPGQHVAAIGPSIGPCCFEVGVDVADAIAAAAPRSVVIVSRAGAKAFADLRAAVREQLMAAGLEDGRIEDVPGCTKHDLRFHSFRRDGANSGRMIAAIAARTGPQG